MTNLATTARASRRRPIAAVAGAVTLLALGACAGQPASDPAPAGDVATSTPAPTGTMPPSHGTATSAPTPGAPIVLELSAPSPMTCAGTAPAQVPVAYTTANATEVAFLVDGAQTPGLGPASGEHLVPVPCDGRSHVLVVTAIGAGGATGTDSIVVTTEAFGAP